MRKLKKNVWPYQMSISMGGLDKTDAVKKKMQMDDWCKHNLGLRFQAWYSYDDTTYDRNSESPGRIFAFKDEAVLLMFKLTWNYRG